LLAALTAQQTFGDGQHLVLDARAAGLGAAAVALVLRAPFLVVVAVAVVVTAGVRAL
ncbi:AzlD domain-containing protein, partial [Streptomyces sp. MCAF7]